MAQQVPDQWITNFFAEKTKKIPDIELNVKKAEEVEKVLSERVSKTSNEYRRASLREIKRELDIPMSQKPINQEMVPLRDMDGNRILNKNKQPVMSRELTYDVKGEKIVIQDHSEGHDFGGVGDQPSHHNVRPIENTDTGKIKGMEKHYYFNKRNQ